MKTINLNHFINIKELIESYKISTDAIVSFNLGYDNKIYILLNHQIPKRIRNMFVNPKSNSVYSLLILTPDWENGKLIDEELITLGTLENNYHFVQPIDNDYLLLGARAYNYKPEPQKNATIISANGTVLNEMCLGDGIEDCFVTSSNHIITSYFDEGIFGNYGWDEPIGVSGLIVWDKEGNSIWKADKYSICDCYAMNLDNKENLWFYYYTDFNLVKTDFKSDVVYPIEIEGAKAFLITEDEKHILLDGGYDDHFNFYVADIKSSRINNYSKVNVAFDYNNLNVILYKFRGSRGIFLDEDYRLFAFWLKDFD